MSDEEIEARARELQQNTPPPRGLGTPPPWEILMESSKEYWRAKARNGESPPAPTKGPAGK